MEKLGVFLQMFFLLLRHEDDRLDSWLHHGLRTLSSAGLELRRRLKERVLNIQRQIGEGSVYRVGQVLELNRNAMGIVSILLTLIQDEEANHSSGGSEGLCLVS